MTHVMRLDAEPFNEVSEGAKTIEVRLNDEKRQLLHIGDTITFLKRPEEKEKCEVEILALKKYRTHEELVNDTPLHHFGPRFKNKQERLNKGGTHYTQEEQQKYGWLGIIIKLVK